MAALAQFPGFLIYFPQKFPCHFNYEYARILPTPPISKGEQQGNPQQ